MADFTAYGGPSKEWLEHVDKYGPPPETPIRTVPVEDIQKQVNKVREEASALSMKVEGLHDKVAIETTNIQARDGYSIPTRIYRPKSASTQSSLPIYIFYHGGGFIYGTANTDDAPCARIVASLPIIVVNAIYRHAPQNPFPAAHNDAHDTYDWVISNAASIGGDIDKIVVGGFSAGANLAASVVLDKHLQQPKIQGLILGIPFLIVDNFPAGYHASPEKTSRVQCKDAPVLPMDVVDFFNNEFKPGKEAHQGSTTERDLAKFPPTSFVVAGNDPLRDDGFFFAEKMQRAGVPLKFHVFPGLPHAFRRFDDLKSSKRWDEIMIESLGWFLEGPKQPGRGSDAVQVVVEDATTGEIEK